MPGNVEFYVSAPSRSVTRSVAVAVAVDNARFTTPVPDLSPHVQAAPPLVPPASDCVRHTVARAYSCSVDSRAADSGSCRPSSTALAVSITKSKWIALFAFNASCSNTEAAECGLCGGLTC